MKKTETDVEETPIEEIPADIVVDKTSLDEFCKGLSTTEKQVELIAGFHHYMKFTQKITKAPAGEFGRHFQNFLVMPA